MGARLAANTKPSGEAPTKPRHSWVSVPKLITQELEDSIWKPNGRARARSEVEGLMEQLFTQEEPNA